MELSSSHLPGEFRREAPQGAKAARLLSSRAKEQADPRVGSSSPVFTWCLLWGLFGFFPPICHFDCLASSP